MSEALAIKYRPNLWEDVCEQSSTKIILQQQLETNTIKNAYLFCGPAGCGKTTCARIFANELNKGQGNPIELDAASNNGVDDVRNIIQQAKSKSLDSEYKVFIIDECHALSNSAWQAMLKIIEEPPAKSIFVFATTDPQKIPKTIISRVQRYDFKRISQKGIVDRLNTIMIAERKENLLQSKDYDYSYRMDALEYIAKIAEGGMRDAITLMDKCLAYSTDLTLENVIKALGTTDYETMFKLLDDILMYRRKEAIMCIENIHNAGKDLKQFVHTFCGFLLDLCKLDCGCDWSYVSIPKLKEYKDYLDDLSAGDYDLVSEWLDRFMKLDIDIKYSATPKMDIECVLYSGIEVSE